MLKKYSKGFRKDSVLVKNTEREIIAELIQPEEDEIIERLERTRGFISINFVRTDGEHHG